MTESGAANSRPIAVVCCALQYELGFLAQSELSTSVTLNCIGPGPNAARASLDELTDRLPDVRDDVPVILVGLAGSLAPACRAGSVWVVSHVVDDAGQSWSATWPDARNPAAIGLTMRRVYGANHVLHSVAEKNEAHHEFAADLVDTESHVFAAWAKANGRRWGIVRAVSDDAETAIPASIENWTRADGRPNLPVIAKDLITHPQWIPVVQRLARTSRDAMQQLIALLCQLRIGESDSKRTRS